MAWRVAESSLPPGRQQLLLPSPDDALEDANATLLERLKRHSLRDLVFFAGKLRPVEEIMMACCAAMGHGGTQYLPAPDAPSPLSLLDIWARRETAILSPALRVTNDAGGLKVVTRRSVREV
jgi:hypothetical protein